MTSNHRDNAMNTVILSMLVPLKDNPILGEDIKKLIELVNRYGVTNQLLLTLSNMELKLASDGRSNNTIFKHIQLIIKVIKLKVDRL